MVDVFFESEVDVSYDLLKLMVINFDSSLTKSSVNTKVARIMSASHVIEHYST